MRIRELEVNDARGYRALRLRALKEHPTAFSTSYEQQRYWPLATFGEQLRTSFDSPDAFILGCFLEESLVGTVGPYREEGPKLMHMAEIRGMHIAVSHHGKGYGRALLVTALERARQMPGLARIRLTVESTNYPARSLFASLALRLMAWRGERCSLAANISTKNSWHWIWTNHTRSKCSLFPLCPWQGSR